MCVLYQCLLSHAGSLSQETKTFIFWVEQTLRTGNEKALIVHHNTHYNLGTTTHQLKVYVEHYKVKSVQAIMRFKHARKQCISKKQLYQ